MDYENAHVWHLKIVYSALKRFDTFLKSYLTPQESFLDLSWHCKNSVFARYIIEKYVLKQNPAYANNDDVLWVFRSALKRFEALLKRFIGLLDAPE